MVKKTLFLILTLCFVYGDEPYTRIMKFNSFIDDEFIIFKINPIKNIPCKFDQIELIALKNRPECIKKKKDILNYEKAHKKAIEAILKPGKNYYVTLLKNNKTHYSCNVSNDKKNINQLLVEMGYALPTSDNKTLQKAHNNARKKFLGMFGGDFKLIGECIVDGTSIPGQEEPDEKATIYKY